MTLVVDVGNTRLKWATADGRILTDRGDVIYRKISVGQVLEQQWSSLRRPDRVVVCNVAGARVARLLSAWVARHWRCPVDFIVARTNGCGVTNGYHVPASLGADRWAALIGAHRKFASPACIVDCGTAITIDVLAAGGRHLGGLILPGLSLMRRALSRHTTGIPEVSCGGLSLLGRSTVDCVAAGTFYAAVALVDRVIVDLEAALETAPTCVVCGGDAELFAPRFARTAICDPDLVLFGAALAAEAIA